MRARAVIAGTAAALVLAMGPGIGALAGEIRVGATRDVKPNSIWFEEAAKLTHWQQLKGGGDPAALASFADDALSHRAAWQFLNPLTVKVLGYEPGTNQVNVEIESPGRMQGSTWFLDAAALVE